MTTLKLFGSIVCAFGISAVSGISMFKFTSSNFCEILTTVAFVDKTLMLKQVIENPGVALITAPPLFGKSTNLNMIKKFLEIEVNEDGTLVTKANLTTEPVTDTNNYKLFVDHKLKITENNLIMNNSFGKSPVLYVDLKCLNIIKTFDEGVIFYREVIHTTYKQYKYLVNSKKLSLHQKTFFDRWFNDTSYKEMSKHHVTHGLRVLSVYLYKHFNGNRVFVLIDDHDSIVSNAMFDVPGAEVLRKIIALGAGMMSTLLRNNDIYVKGGLISGVSDLPIFGFSDLNNVNTYRFLGKHRFTDFYGLTVEEVEMLFHKPEFNLSPKAIKEAHAAYSGYQSEGGTTIYNIYSVLRFLKKGEVKYYWTKFGTAKKLRNVFKIPAFKHYIEKLVEDKSISIVILEKLTVEDVIDLRNLLLQPHSQINYWPDTLFNFLFKQGYLTFLPHADRSGGVLVKKRTVKLPNTEVRDYFRRLQ